MTKQSTVEEILRLPYQRVLVPDADSGRFTAQVAEFPGCIAEGDTPAQAYESLERVAAEWVAAVLEEGREVPRPRAVEEYSGRVVLRMPKSLHRRASEAAANEGVSLNTLLVAAVSEYVGGGRAGKYPVPAFLFGLVPQMTTAAPPIGVPPLNLAFPGWTHGHALAESRFISVWEKPERPPNHESEARARRELVRG